MLAKIFTNGKKFSANVSVRDRDLSLHPSTRLPFSPYAIACNRDDRSETFFMKKIATADFFFSACCCRFEVFHYCFAWNEIVASSAHFFCVWWGCLFMLFEINGRFLINHTRLLVNLIGMWLCGNFIFLKRGKYFFYFL